jgi:hypothetical protein
MRKKTKQSNEAGNMAFLLINPNVAGTAASAFILSTIRIFCLF